VQVILGLRWRLSTLAFAVKLTLWCMIEKFVWFIRLELKLDGLELKSWLVRIAGGEGAENRHLRKFFYVMLRDSSLGIERFFSRFVELV